MAVWPMYTSFFTEMLTYIDYPRVTFAKQLVYSAEQDQLSPETKQRIKQIAESLWEQKFEVRKSEDFLEAMMQVQNELTDLISQYPNATSTESLYQ